MTEWTADQRRVIDSPAEKLICAAAAGSGKTAVMIERIARLIQEGADPFSFLVITFTNAAAAEMKEKIRKRLISQYKDPVLEVCTIHAFCQRLIHMEFQTAGVDPMFQICTAARQKELFEGAFRRGCNRLKKEQNEDYLSFTRKYDSKETLEIVEKVYGFMMSQPDPFGWLAEKTEQSPLDYDQNHPWFVTVARILEEQLTTARVLLRRQAEMFDAYEKVEAYRQIFRADSELVDSIGRWIQGMNVERAELEKPFVKLPPLRNLNDLETDWKERYQELREKLKERCEEMRSLILIDRNRMRKELNEIHQSLLGLKIILEETHSHFVKSKERLRLLDFNDLEHRALRVLTDEGCGESIRGRYRYIFVDECQDISSIQDTLIRKVAGEQSMLFMVGDVKQSIYRFRMANPKLFQRQMREVNEVLPLRHNFRSRPEILETANTVFRDLMTSEVSELAYDPEMDDLHPGRTDTPGNIPVRVDLLEKPANLTALETTANHVAGEIGELISRKKAELRDIVILMPEVSTDGPLLAEMLKAKGIPVFFDGNNDFFSRQEVEQFRNLLKLLDDPHQDLPLLTLLGGPVLHFSDEELSLIRFHLTGRDEPFWKAFEQTAETETELGKRCQAIRKKLDYWRYLAEHTTLDTFCWYLMEDSSLYAIAGAMQNGQAAQKNLRSFCMQAGLAVKKGICTLRDFLIHLSVQESSGEMQAAASLGERDQLVRLMTMHKSKGLQFPVVFCLGLNRSLTASHPSPVLIDEELGICLNYKVPECRLSRKTAANRLFAWKNEHGRKAEKICLLYVAMTRAQERLYLVGTRTDDSLWHMKAGDTRVFSASDYQDWIMPALMDAEKVSTGNTQREKPWKITIFEDYQQQNVEKVQIFHSLDTWLDSLLSAAPVDELWKGFSTKKEDDDLLKKFSVSSLLRDARERIFAEETDQTPDEKRMPKLAGGQIRGMPEDACPAFMVRHAGYTGAFRGTVNHRFLSLVSLDEIRPEQEREKRLNRQLEQMTAERVFTQEEAALVRTDRIGLFFQSALGCRLLKSREVRREWEFNLSLPERKMIVQGMIDCAFREEEGWILLDYKTDRIDDEDRFVEEYRPQLAWYRTALEKLTGLPVQESWIYSLFLDKAFRLDGERETAEAVPDAVNNFIHRSQELEK